MVVIPIEDLESWQAYCEEHPHVSAYKNKKIENWDDICVLVGCDRAMGDEAAQHEECANAMDAEMEGVSSSETSSGCSNKKIKRDRLVDAVSSFAESFMEFVTKTNGPPKPSAKDIYAVVFSVLGLSRQQALKAVKRFMSGSVDEFEMLQNLPEQEKLDWILLCINDD